MRGSAIVLTYHRVGDTDDDPHRLAMSAANFAQQMDVIATEHAVITATELADAIKTDTRLPRRAVVVTFDDGYAETHAIAQPIMSSLSVRATSFLCTGCIGVSGEYPWDSDRATARASRRVMSADEVRWQSHAGTFEFGAHTRTHPRLSALNEAAQAREIIDSKAELASLIGDEIRLFAYPHGGPDDFDPVSLRVVDRAGYTAAFSTLPGIVTVASERLALPRFHTEDIPADEFRALLARWFNAAR